MTVQKHKRLEELKDLLNFQEDGFFHQYCNGYKQAEQDLKPDLDKAISALWQAQKDICSEMCSSRRHSVCCAQATKTLNDLGLATPTI